MTTIELPADPQPIELDLARSAVIVVDMQNAFASPGGMLDLAGIDVTPAGDAVVNTRLVCEAARALGMRIIYLTMGFPPDLSTAGGPDSPNPQKELALRLMRERPELRGKLLTFGSWDFQIVDALQPRPEDTVVMKSRYSGFFGTALDAILRSHGVRNLLMTGVASNVCVESTIRDAFFLEYWPILIADATMPAGSAEIQRATIYNVSTFFGWVANAEDVATALRAAATAIS